MPDVVQDERTIGALLRALTADFRAAGLDGPGNDARRLLAAAAGLTPAQLLAALPGQMLPREHADTLEGYRRCRLAREPVSRILGRRDFYGRRFVVSPATLDPRPDSETLITTALAAARERPGPLRILDVGTGTGCLLITLLCELPSATGVGTDISSDALDTAAANASRLGVADRVRWQRADLLDGIAGPFDILVSNPPYIPSAVIPTLDPEVRAYDPIGALDGGSDGLDLYRRLLPGISAVIPDGWIILEAGYDQAPAVAALLASPPHSTYIQDIALHLDVTGRQRCVAARTRALSR